jgi:hypothetical protein
VNECTKVPTRYVPTNIRCVVVNRKNHKWVFFATFTITFFLFWLLDIVKKHSLF